MKRVLVVVLAALLLLGTTLLLLRDEQYDWHLQEGFPRPAVPDDNPMSNTKVELGRWLFYETRLSVNGTMSCASCHIQALAFTDGKRQSIGATGEFHPRSSMSLVNTAYASRLTWASPILDRLEDQALVPMFGDHPVEMGMAGKEAQIIEILETDGRYSALTRDAFPDDENPYSVLNAVRAIAAFVRSIVSFESPYDHFIAGDESALTPSAQRGMDLFFSERLECFHCHGGFNFTDSTTHENASVERVGYHNTGLYNLYGDGAYPNENTGLFDMTGERRDMGRFKAPTLRNVAVTAPYMHDGSVATLEDALSHYERGGRLIETGPHAGDGRLSPFKSEFVRGFELSATERTDLLAFLMSLTDHQVLNDPALSRPLPEKDRSN